MSKDYTKITIKDVLDGIEALKAKINLEAKAVKESIDPKLLTIESVREITGDLENKESTLVVIQRNKDLLMEFVGSKDINTTTVQDIIDLADSLLAANDLKAEEAKDSLDPANLSIRDLRVLGRKLQQHKSKDSFFKSNRDLLISFVESL